MVENFDANGSVDVSVIIVNFNSGDLTCRCLASIKDSLAIPYEVIVVDNASNDGSVNSIRAHVGGDPRFTLVAISQNIGFAKANNHGVRQARGRILHFLNPDTIVFRELSEAYRQIMESSEPTLYVTPLLDEQKHPTKSSGVLPTLKDYWCEIVGGSARRWWVGASVLMKKDVFHALGGWPEDYFMYAEDLDLFYRAHLLHIPIAVLPAPLMHVGRGSTQRVWSPVRRSIRTRRSYRKFAKKYGLLPDYYILSVLTLLRMLIRNPREAWVELRALFIILLEPHGDDDSAHR